MSKRKMARVGTLIVTGAVLLAALLVLVGGVAADHDGGTDTALPPPNDSGIYPFDGQVVDFSDPFFIDIWWSSEGYEYTGDAHSSVTLTKAKLDGEDVLPFASVSPFIDYSWSISIQGIALVEHTLTFNGEDDAGNTLPDDQLVTFTVVEPPRWELDLGPGLNLVSIPTDPANKEINAVFGDVIAVDLVFTRKGNKWLVGARDPDTGKFPSIGGTTVLRTIDSRHAYFVRATASTTVEMDLAPVPLFDPLLLAQTSVPPKLRVKRNRWTLVPVMSLKYFEEIPYETELDADQYFGDNWRVAWTFDRGRWVSIVPGMDPDGDSNTLDDAIQIGRGYWVWFTETDFIIPR